MRFFGRAFLALAASVPLAFGQAADSDAPPAAQPLRTLDVPDDGIRVAVLGYHDFSETERETAMRIRTSKFRKQMEAIRQLGIPVIPMADFIAWTTPFLPLSDLPSNVLRDTPQKANS